ncbi:MAG: hypothetical protein LBF93_01875 [Zoogloeaceae bacterium]|jgi:hypothetical protein|nr:hypothetical protein [Zoogloeaceae bacterium]
MREIEFQTDFFKPLPGEDKETNPGCYGKSLALWLAERLKGKGFVIKRVIPEDFGWCIAIACPDPACDLWLMCGNTDKAGKEWMVWSVGHVAFWKRLFRGMRPVLPELEKLDRHLRELLPAIPGIVFSGGNGEWKAIN